MYFNVVPMCTLIVHTHTHTHTPLTTGISPHSVGYCESHHLLWLRISGSVPLWQGHQLCHTQHKLVLHHFSLNTSCSVLRHISFCTHSTAKYGPHPPTNVTCTPYTMCTLHPHTICTAELWVNNPVLATYIILLSPYHMRTHTYTHTQGG